MTDTQPRIRSEDGSRSLACAPAAVIVLLVNAREELLVGRHRTRDRWEAVSGVLEARESILDGALRELREEMGPEVRARPVSVIHASSFHYDAHARFMLSITWLMAYEGGRIAPGDDMAGGGHRWVPLQALAAGDEVVHIPRDRWVLARAIDAYRLWKDDAVVLQSPLLALE